MDSLVYHKREDGEADHHIVGDVTYVLPASDIKSEDNIKAGQHTRRRTQSDTAVSIDYLQVPNPEKEFSYPENYRSFGRAPKKPPRSWPIHYPRKMATHLSEEKSIDDGDRKSARAQRLFRTVSNDDSCIDHSDDGVSKAKPEEQRLLSDHSVTGNGKTAENSGIHKLKAEHFDKAASEEKRGTSELQRMLQGSKQGVQIVVIDDSDRDRRKMVKVDEELNVKYQETPRWAVRLEDAKCRGATCCGAVTIMLVAALALALTLTHSSWVDNRSEVAALVVAVESQLVARDEVERLWGWKAWSSSLPGPEVHNPQTEDPNDGLLGVDDGSGDVIEEGHPMCEMHNNVVYTGILLLSGRHQRAWQQFESDMTWNHLAGCPVTLRIVILDGDERVNQTSMELGDPRSPSTRTARPLVHLMVGPRHTVWVSPVRGFDGQREYSLISVSSTADPFGNFSSHMEIERLVGEQLLWDSGPSSSLAKGNL